MMPRVGRAGQVCIRILLNKMFIINNFYNDGEGGENWVCAYLTSPKLEIYGCNLSKSLLNFLFCFYGAS